MPPDCLRPQVRLMRRSAGGVVTWMEENSCSNGEVYAVVFFNQSGDVLLGGSPDGDVVFHVIGTVLQQAGEGVGVSKIFALAERVGCRS
jgi:hypothetical protein